MKYIKIGIIVLSIFFINACSNKPVSTTNVVNTRTLILNNGKNINISTVHAINGDVNTNTKLNLVTKTDRAKAVGVKVLQVGLSLFTGGTTSAFTKEQLKGNYVESVDNKTVDYVNPKIDLLLNELKINSSQPNDVLIRPYIFKLIYGDTGDNYDFTYTFSIKVNDYYNVCSSHQLDSSDKSKPFDQWEKNNYELTQIIAKKVVDNCFEKMQTSSEKEKLENAINKKIIN